MISMKHAAFAVVLSAALLAAAVPGRSQPSSDPPPAARPAPAGTAAGPATRPAPVPATAPAAVHRANPFAPAASAAPVAAGAAVAVKPAATQPAAAPALPTLEGLAVCGKTVLACFRTAQSTVVVAPGDVFLCGAGHVTFVSYQDETVIVKDASGKECKLRISVGTGSGARPARPPQAPRAYAADEL